MTQRKMNEQKKNKESVSVYLQYAHIYAPPESSLGKFNNVYIFGGWDIWIIFVCVAHRINNKYSARMRWLWAPSLSPTHSSSLCALHALIFGGMVNKMLTAIENIYPNSQDAARCGNICLNMKYVVVAIHLHATHAAVCKLLRKLDYE